MKTLSVLLFACMVSLALFAQAPQALNYQAVARDNNGQVLPNQGISIRFTILQGNINGSAVYQETHSVTTNDFGLFTIPTGNGTPVSGVFSSINWGNGPYFLKVEIDVTGGSSYVDMGTSQFLSVPYALYAETAMSYENCFRETDTSTYEVDSLVEIDMDNDSINDGFNVYFSRDSLYWNKLLNYNSPKVRVYVNGKLVTVVPGSGLQLSPTQLTRMTFVAGSGRDPIARGDVVVLKILFEYEYCDEFILFQHQF